MPEWLTDERSVLWAATFLYALTAIVGGLRMVTCNAWIQLTAYVLLWGGFGTQLLGLSIRGSEVGGCPLGNPFEIIQFIIWSSVFLFLVTFPFIRLNLLGALVAGSTAIISAISLLFGAWDYATEAAFFGGNPWIELHAALAMFSYGMLGVLALMSLMFLVQQAALKRKVTLPILSILPSVRELDILGARLLVTGISLMSLALVVGFMFWLQNPEATSPVKLVVTSIIWIAYGIAGAARLWARLPARRFAQASVFLYACVVVSIGPISGDPIEGTGADITEEDAS